jgi:hypothetical protein
LRITCNAGDGTKEENVTSVMAQVMAELEQFQKSKETQIFALILMA